MVCGYHIYRAVKHSRNQCFSVLGTSERRIHFESCVFLKVGIVKNKVVRSRFAGDVYAYYMRSGTLGSDISSDKHLQQLYVFLPLYAEALERIVERCPNIPKVAALYRKDLIGRYICRVLNVYLTRKTKMLNCDNISVLYEMMSVDKGLGIFSVRTGQIFNLLLYKIGKPRFTVAVYKFTAFVSSLFRSKK